MATKAIIFDFDGTIADTAVGITSTMKETFRHMGLPVPAEEDMRATIGLPLRDSLRMLNHLNETAADEATRVYRQLFPAFEARLISIFPGVAETLARLAEEGFRMAIATSREVVSLESIMRACGISGYFEERVTNSDHVAPKPSPEMVEVMLGRMRLAPGEAIVVGDTTFDILMGSSAGCRTVAVTYGNHSRERLLTANPDFIIDSLAELRSQVIPSLR